MQETKFDFTFNTLESKLILQIAYKPYSIKYLYRQYNEKICSRASFYRAIKNLQEKAVIKYDKSTGVLQLKHSWISDGFDFFQKLKRYKRLDGVAAHGLQ